LEGNLFFLFRRESLQCVSLPFKSFDWIEMLVDKEVPKPDWQKSNLFIHFQRVQIWLFDDTFFPATKKTFYSALKDSKAVRLLSFLSASGQH
jgi:hypothetical protein